MILCKRRRSYIDLSQKDIARLPEAIRKWVDQEYLSKRLESDDLGERVFSRGQFSRLSTLSEARVGSVGHDTILSDLCFLDTGDPLMYSIHPSF
jgi:hypothetical protein